MKHVLTILLFLFAGFSSSLSGNVHAGGISTAKDLSSDAKEALPKQVPILVLFKGKSCPFCDTVLKDFLLPMQRDPQYNDKVIMRQIDTASKDKLIDFDGNLTTQNAFSRKNKVWGVPVVMLFDSQGHVLTTITGLLIVDFYRAYLDNAISDSQEIIKQSQASATRIPSEALQSAQQ
jgi:thioredoxin-related protein